MVTIIKPMLAATLTSIDELDFDKHTYLATPKLDGIRALMIDGKLVSRTFKPIRNKHIRKILEGLLPDGADGEIIVKGNNFQETSSGVMSEDGEPDFVFYWFDWVDEKLDEPYEKRVQRISRVIDTGKHMCSVEMADYDKYIIPLTPTKMDSKETLKYFEEQCLDQGYEGVIIRTANGPYKFGRSTMKEQYLMKFKRFVDDEATVIGFEEKMHNDNEAEKDAFGRTKRSTAMSGLSAANTLGALTVKDIKTGVEFSIGTGFDDELRKEIWNHRPKYKGTVVKYKHFAQSGTKDAPRFPVFIGFRDKEDM